MLLELDGIVGFVLLALWVYCVLDVIASEGALVRNLPKTMWLFIVIFIPDIGSIAWLLLGRPEGAGWAPGSTSQRAAGGWFGADRPPPAHERIANESVIERDRLLAQWDAEEVERKQALRDLVDRETQVKKREAELRLIEARIADREAERRAANGNAAATNAAATNGGADAAAANGNVGVTDTDDVIDVIDVDAAGVIDLDLATAGNAPTVTAAATGGCGATGGSGATPTNGAAGESERTTPQ